MRYLTRDALLFKLGPFSTHAGVIAKQPTTTRYPITAPPDADASKQEVQVGYGGSSTPHRSRRTYYTTIPMTLEEYNALPEIPEDDPTAAAIEAAQAQMTADEARLARLRSISATTPTRVSKYAPRDSST